MTRRQARDDEREDLVALCCVPSCREWIPVARVMCEPHWRRVPYPLRQEIGEAVLDERPDQLADAKRRAGAVVARRERPR